MRAKRQRVFLAVCMMELPRPDSRPARHHFNVQAAAVEHLVQLGPGFGVLDLEFGKGWDEIGHDGFLCESVRNH